MNQTSKHAQLSEALTKAIWSGDYRPGDRIETENELAARFRVSRQTVRQALQKLEAEGLISRRRGSGTYVERAVRPSVRTMRIGVVSTYLSEYIFPAILRGIETHLSENGYAMVLSATRNRVDNERRILQDALRNPVDGLIIEGTKTALPNPNVPLLQTLIRQGTPVVFLNGCYDMTPPPVCVKTDDAAGGREAVRFLKAEGRTRVAGLFKSDDRQGLDRYAGYIQGLMAADLPLSDERVLWFTTENRDQLLSGENAPAILRCLNDTDAVVCYNDEVAVRLCDLLRAHGRRVPEDVRLVSFDRSRYAAMAGYPIPSQEHPKEALGALCARKLLRLIGGAAEKSETLPFGGFDAEPMAEARRVGD